MAHEYTGDDRLWQAADQSHHMVVMDINELEEYAPHLHVALMYVNMIDCY